MKLDSYELELTEKFPETVVNMVAMIGWEATLALVCSLGGLQIDIPKTTSHKSKIRQMLISIIGIEATKQLIKFMAGERLYVPKCSSSLKWLRDKQFYDCVEMELVKGFSKAAAVRMHAPIFGLCDRQAYEILRQQQPDAQLSLWD